MKAFAEYALVSFARSSACRPLLPTDILLWPLNWTLLRFLRTPHGCSGEEEDQKYPRMFKETLEDYLMKIQLHHDIHMQVEAQRGAGTCSRSHSWLAAEPEWPEPVRTLLMGLDLLIKFTSQLLLNERNGKVPSERCLQGVGEKNQEDLGVGQELPSENLWILELI